MRWSDRDIREFIDSAPVATTRRNGLAPKLPGDATKFLGGTGVYSVPASSAPITEPGTKNLFVGTGAGNVTLTGVNNTAISNGAGFVLTSGTHNVFIGVGAGQSVAAATRNVIIGASAGQLVAGTGATSNTVIGYNAGATLETGTNNVVIGANADVTSATSSGRIAIGVSASCDIDNHAVIGFTTVAIKSGNTDGTCTLGTAARSWKGIYFDYTTTAVGTTGNRTINKPAGRVNIAAAGTTVTVTNSLVTADSLVMAWCMTADATARVTNVVPAAGSFVVNIVAATAETAIGFVLINTD